MDQAQQQPLLRYLPMMYQQVLDATPWQRLVDQMSTDWQCRFLALSARTPGATISGFRIHDCNADMSIAELAAIDILDAEIAASHGSCWQIASERLQALGLSDSQLWVVSQASEEVQLNVYLSWANKMDNTIQLEWCQQQVLPLMVHWLAAAELHRELLKGWAAQAFIGNYLDGLAIAAVVIEDTGNVIVTNELADQLVVSSPLMRLQQGRFSLQSRQQNQLFFQRVAQVCEHWQQQQQLQPSGMRLGDSELQSLTLIIKPIPQPATTSQTRPTVMVLIHQVETKAQFKPGLLQAIHNLTPAEANLAVLLANAYSPDQAAEELGVSVNTVRSQVRAIFAKTGVSRMNDLQRLLWYSLV